MRSRQTSKPDHARPHCSPRRFSSHLYATALLCFGTLTLRANPLDPWVWRSPCPQGDHLAGAAYGAGVFVGVGGTGTVMTSPDGTNWLTQALGADYSFLCVAYGQTQFVASALILGSPSGVFVRFSHRPMEAIGPARSSEATSPVVWPTGPTHSLGSCPTAGLPSRPME